MIDVATKVLEKKVRFKCHLCKEPTLGFTGTQRVNLELCKGCFGKNKDRRKKELNDLSGADWARFSLSLQQYPDNRSEKQRKHGACFPQSLAEQYILKYTKRGDMVLDPFIGVGTTLDACIKLGRSCSGTDINSSFCKVARKSIPMNSQYSYFLRTCDAESIDNYIEKGSIDFIITSPPYASLLKSINHAFAYKWKEHSSLSSIANPKPYTKNKDDLGNMTHEEFFLKLENIMSKLYKVLKQRKYMAWVVKDYRDLKNGMPYVNFHSDVINCAKKTNFLLWDIVIYDQTKFRPLVCLGYPSSRYYHNIGHSYILVFRKGHD